MAIHLISTSRSELPLLDEIISFISPVSIYVPWGQDLPDLPDNKTITASYPPEELKPDVSFDKIFRDYMTLMEDYSDRSRKEIIKTGSVSTAIKESFRQIKKQIGDRVANRRTAEDNKIKWHLLLYMSDQLESSRIEANSMLKKLRKMPSPLANSIDQTGKTEHPLQNLTEFNQDSILNEARLKHTLAAWFELFGGNLNDGDVLLTFSRHIFECLVDEWDTITDAGELNGRRGTCFRFPPFARTDNGEGSHINNSLDAGNICEEIKAIINSEKIGLQEKKSQLEILAGRSESMIPKDLSQDHILFTFNVFQSPEASISGNRNVFIRFLKGKILLLAEVYRKSISD